MEPAFRELVDRIYGIMTKQTAGKPAREGAFPGSGLGMALKHVSSNMLAGLMETVDAKLRARGALAPATFARSAPLWPRQS